MAKSRRLRLWIVVALAVLIIGAVAVLVVLGIWPNALSPRPSTGESPLPTPTPLATVTPSFSWFDVRAALVWVVLGSLLALGIVLLIVRRYRRDA